ncbi:hypothetical protein RI054_03g19260 [Pseudoscourfieldia marina]
MPDSASLSTTAICQCFARKLTACVLWSVASPMPEHVAQTFTGYRSSDACIGGNFYFCTLGPVQSMISALTKLSMGVPKPAVMSAIDSAEGILSRLTAPRTQGLKYTLSFALRQAEENVRTILVAAKAAVPPKKEKQEPKEETKKRGADGGAGGGGGKSTRPKWAEDLAKEMKAMASTASQAGSTMPAQTHERRIGGNPKNPFGCIREAQNAGTCTMPCKFSHEEEKLKALR